MPKPTKAEDIKIVAKPPEGFVCLAARGTTLSDGMLTTFDYDLKTGEKVNVEQEFVGSIWDV